MEALLTKLFITHGAVQATLVLALTICFGILLGRIKIMSVSFGIGGILFSGIILGHFGMSLDPRVLVFAREFGLILFVYAIGISVGPTFLDSLRDQGLKLNLMSMYIVFTGAAIALCCYFIFSLTIPQTAGIFCGSVTNTPALGSANEAWSLVAGSQDAVSQGLQTIGQAYAVCYPFGIFGIILTMMILKGMFHIDVQAELAREEAKHHEAIFTRPELTAGTQRMEIIVSNSRVSGKARAGIVPSSATDISIIRNGEEIKYNGQWTLRLEDLVVAESADPKKLDELAKKLGNNRSSLAHPQMLSIFAGIFVGVFLGSIPVFVPGLPTGIKLGVAGGTLLVAIFLGRAQRFCGMSFYMTNSSNQIMREIGILLFLACVGLHAGTGFVETVVNGPGLAWMGMGAFVTFVPLCSAALICRACWNINFPAICGMLSGCSTQPAALAFAMQYYGGRIPAQAYSTVYPLTMILRILVGQLLVLILAGMA